MALREVPIEHFVVFASDQPMSEAVTRMGGDPECSSVGCPLNSEPIQLAYGTILGGSIGLRKGFSNQVGASEDVGLSMQMQLSIKEGSPGLSSSVGRKGVVQ